jgi:hypothetical protein
MAMYDMSYLDPTSESRKCLNVEPTVHLDARANDPRISLRALGSPLLTCTALFHLLLASLHNESK